jgi:hypothetical protein
VPGSSGPQSVPGSHMAMSEHVMPSEGEQVVTSHESVVAASEQHWFCESTVLIHPAQVHTPPLHDPLTHCWLDEHG